MTTSLLAPRPEGGDGVVHRLRAVLARGRGEVEALHRSGTLGGQVASALTDLCDRIIVTTCRDAIERVPVPVRPRVLQELALVGVGGYGRGDLAPWSDIDLLILHAPRAHPAAREVASTLVRDLWDIGLQLGHSVRTPADAVAFARKDLHHRTALTEARLIDGSSLQFGELQRRVHHLLASGPLDRFLDAALAERAKEFQDYYAATVYLLEPNVKKSPGGLRDLHLLRWVALCRYGTRDPEMLRVGGILSREDAETLAGAAEFLRRIRHELHFHARGPQDVLTRDEQMRLAAWLGFADQGPLRGVERFMQQYYRHTTALHDAVMRFVEGSRRRAGVRRLVNRLLTTRIESHFLATRDQVSIDPSAGPGVFADGASLLGLFDLARRRSVSVAHETLERIRAAAPACAVTPAVSARFLQILENPAGLGDLLRNLHRVGLLSRLIPAFEHVRCLIQFNRYHKYTVDEHSLRAVEAAARRAWDPGPVGQAYREVGRKDLLHLALLLHDLGKGLGDDHCETGRRIALDTAESLGLPPHDRDLLAFLVHQHLLMAHTAFRRDVSDVQTLVQFARRAGTPEALRMLFVLTAADTEAVSPESWNAWKESLLHELYIRTAEELTGEAPLGDERARAETVRAELRRALGAEFPPEWLEAQFAVMPVPYLLTTEARRVGEHLRALRDFDGSGVRVVADYRRETGLTRLTVFTRDGITPGLFSKIAGVLAAVGFQIVGAQIVTRADGIVIDTFWGVDLDYAGEPPPDRRRESAQHIEEVLLGRQTVEALFARRGPTHSREGAHGPPGPTQVEIDNDSSDRFTIIEVFADDRQGLLYAITKSLFDLGLSVSSAKISTRIDQVADVFYVTERGAGKVADPGRLDAIRRRLVADIEAFEAAPPGGVKSRVHSP